MAGVSLRLGGNINIESAPQLALGQVGDPPSGLELGWPQGPERQLLGAERNGQHRTARRRPYDISRGSHLRGPTHSLSPPDNQPSTSNNSTIEYSTDLGPLSSSSRMWSSALVPSLKPLLIPHLPSPQPEAPGLDGLPFPRTTGNASSEQYPPMEVVVDRTLTGPYSSPEFDPVSTTPEQRGHAFTADVSEHPLGSNMAVINPPVLPWDPPQDVPRTSISGGTFITGNVNHIQRHGEKGLHILHQAAVGNAFYDSAERYPQPRCHPQTRTRILDDLWNWSSETGPRSTVLWLHGPAGSGKSAIAQSFCENLEAGDRLGASFFFKRGHTSRGSATKLFSTIAYQLALPKNLPDLHRVISQRVEDDPSILDRSLLLQLKELIIEPCRQIRPSRPPVIVIDGLDECEGQHIQQEILRSIGNSIGGEDLPLRFLIASRPEPNIRDIFVGPCLKCYHCPLNILSSFGDVYKYLRDQFTRIRAEHHDTMAAVPDPWPAEEIIQKLVDKSSGYFIYASTIVKFIDDKYFRPTERLDIIMGIAEPDFESPFSALDQLYIQILVNVPQTIQPRLLLILTVFATKWNLKVPRIEQLLGLKPGDVQLALRGVHSIVKIDEEFQHVTAHHASFLDFLDNPTRSGMFYVGGSQQRTDLACHILKAFSYKYDDPFINVTGPVVE
ncbi:hypothetical protein B0H14DRAFT_2509303 [Mycena olivaceomarginata]|nr:hypothetical protein B0H14DRAFT_2509303 [Mycena olivaceomarginata]